MTDSALCCRGLTVGYGDSIVLDHLDLEVLAGETVALLGPSGSGKTTLLYAVAGLLPTLSGTIEIANAVVGPATPPEERSVGMVFQNYALWPHLDALRTVAYPLLRRGLERGQAELEADRLLGLVGIGELRGRLPDQLSGGQQQRVGLARALATRASLYLFDEPTAHLDAGLRDLLQAELIDRSIRGDAAALYTTHDATEAMSVADRIAVMRGGRIVQIGPPQSVYSQPVDLWVAHLGGPASVIDAELISVGDDEVEVSVLGDRHRVAGGASCEPGPVALVVRPDWTSIGGALQGSVQAVRYEGPHTDYLVATGAGAMRIRQPGVPHLAVGAPVGWSLDRVWAVSRDRDHAIG